MGDVASLGFPAPLIEPDVRISGIRFKDPESGKTLVFVTNNCSLPAAIIRAIYESREPVELIDRAGHRGIPETAARGRHRRKNVRLRLVLHRMRSMSILPATSAAVRTARRAGGGLAGPASGPEKAVPSGRALKLGWTPFFGQLHARVKLKSGQSECRALPVGVVARR